MGAVKNIMKNAGRAVAGTVPAVVLVRLGVPALAALVFLAVLMLGVICWIISSGDRSDRMTRMILARQGDARCLPPTPSSPSVPASRSNRPARRHQTVRSGRDTTPP